MSGGGAPADHSVELEQMRINEAHQAQAAQDAKDAADKARLAELRSNAITGARGSARSYFENNGLVADDYEPTIDDVINQIAAGISSEDPNPGAYFAGAGARAYDTAQTTARNKATRDINNLLPSDFERTRISDTLDDPTLAAIEAEQRQEADNYVQNLLKRGVITNTGATAAEGALDKQKYGVEARLNELGNLTLESGRSNLRDIANRGRSTASTFNLGTSFDPNTYSSQVDQAFNEFLKNLGGTIRGKVSGNFFDTSGLPIVAGAAQGGQNTKYDPKAIAGLTEEDDTTKPRTNASTGIF